MGAVSWSGAAALWLAAAAGHGQPAGAMPGSIPRQEPQAKADRESLGDLEQRLLAQLGSRETNSSIGQRAGQGSDLDRDLDAAWSAVAGGDARGIRPWLAGLLVRARGLEAEDAARPFSLLDPQMRAYLAQPLARMALDYGSQGEAATILSHAARNAQRWQVGIRCSSVMAQLQVARGDFADALGWCKRAEELLAGQPEGRARDLYSCEVAGRRFETALALGLIDEAARSLGAESELADRLVQEEDPSYASAGKGYVLSAEIHGLDLDLARQLFGRVARRCEKRLASKEAEVQGKTLFLLRQSAALAELVREDPERWRSPAKAALVELLDGGLGPGPERRATLVRALDVAPGDERANAWLAELENAQTRGALSLQERSDLALLRLERASPAELPRAEQTLDRIHTEWLQAWNDVPAPTGGLGFLEFARRRRVVAALVGARLTMDPGPAGVLHALEVVFREQGLGSLTRELQETAPPSSLRGALEVLAGKDRALLAYVWGRDTGWLLWVDEEGACSAPLAAPRVVEKLRRRVSAHTIPDAGASKTLAELSDLLLPRALRSRMQRAGLWHITGLERLGQLPYARLDDGRGPLGVTTALCTLPALQNAQQLAARRAGDPELSGPPRPRDSGPAVLVVSAPEVDPAIARNAQLDPIPWSEVEQHALIGHPEAGGLALTKDQASHGQLLQATPANYDVLHLVCHGAPAERDGRAALWLAPDSQHPDGRITYADLQQLRFPDLVVLSACAAGRSATRRGDDAYAHLGGVFLSRGATGVILSPEPVLYATVREWSPSFRAALRSGADPAEALRRSRAALQGSALQDALAWQLVGVVPNSLAD